MKSVIRKLLWVIISNILRRMIGLLRDNSWIMLRISLSACFSCATFGSGKWSASRFRVDIQRSMSSISSRSQYSRLNRVAISGICIFSCSESMLMWRLARSAIYTFEPVGSLRFLFSWCGFFSGSIWIHKLSYPTSTSSSVPCSSSRVSSSIFRSGLNGDSIGLERTHFSSSWISRYGEILLKNDTELFLIDSIVAVWGSRCRHSSRISSIRFARKLASLAKCTSTSVIRSLSTSSFILPICGVTRKCPWES